MPRDWTWVTPHPSSNEIDEAYDDVKAVLENDGWQVNDNTIIKALATTVGHIGHSANVQSHVTINIADLKTAIGAALQDEAVASAAQAAGEGDAATAVGVARTLTDHVASMHYHATFEVADAYSDAGNPRWYSDGRGEAGYVGWEEYEGDWSVDDITTAVEEAGNAVGALGE